MSEQPSTLAGALAAFQAKLPAILKDKTAEVKSERTGKAYKYNYADLAQVVGIVMPLLGAVGLSFTAKPTLNEQGRFVLAYRLLHASGESDCGEYPLPAQGSAQEYGSAITYARRYALCSVTGVAPDEDDDGAAANTRMDTRHTPEIDPVESQLIAEAFEQEIGKCRSQDELTDLGNSIKKTRDAHEITGAQFARLKVAGGARRAELDKEAGPA